MKLQWSISIHRTDNLRWFPPVRGLQVWEWTQFSTVGEQAKAFRFFFYAWKRRFRSLLSLSLQNKWCVLCEQSPVPDLMSWFRNYATPAKYLHDNSLVLWCPEQSTNTLTQTLIQISSHVTAGNRTAKIRQRIKGRQITWRPDEWLEKNREMLAFTSG